jgi:hypothetical protein
MRDFLFSGILNVDRNDPDLVVLWTIEVGVCETRVWERRVPLTPLHARGCQLMKFPFRGSTG